MEEFAGMLVMDGNSFRVTGVLEVREKDGQKKWSGYFIPPQDCNFALGVSHDGPHQLRLDDSRAGEVMLANIDMDGAGTTVVDFDGEGPLRAE